MNCEQARESMDALALGTLDDAAPVNEHLRTCSACARGFDRVRGLVALLEKAADAPFEGGAVSLAPAPRRARPIRWMMAAAILLLAVPGVWFVLQTPAEIRTIEGSLLRYDTQEPVRAIPIGVPLVAGPQGARLEELEGGRLVLQPACEIVFQGPRNFQLKRGELECQARSLAMSVRVPSGMVEAASTSVLRITAMNQSKWVVVILVLSGSALYSEPSRSATIAAGQSLRVSASGEWVQEEDNPEYKRWSKFKVGSWVRMARSGNAWARGGELIELIELTDEKAVIRTTAQAMPGGRLPAAGEREIPAKRQKKDEAKPSASGDEELTIGEAKLKCHWVETESKGQGNTIKTKTWTCDEVPGGVVQSETTYTPESGAAGTSHKSTATEWKAE